MEAVAWWGLQGRVTETLGDVAVWFYLLLAFGLLPVYVPVAIALLEPDRDKRRAMVHLAVLGGAVALVLVATMIQGPVEASIGGRYIAYRIGLGYGGFVVAGYVMATCGLLLLSSHQVIVRFGKFNLVAVAVLAWLNTSGFASLWCAWAAMASLGIAFGLRSGALVRSDPTGSVERPAANWRTSKHIGQQASWSTPVSGIVPLDHPWDRPRGRSGCNQGYARYRGTQISRTIALWSFLHNRSSGSPTPRWSRCQCWWPRR